MKDENGLVPMLSRVEWARPIWFHAIWHHRISHGSDHIGKDSMEISPDQVCAAVADTMQKVVFGATCFHP